MRGQIKAALVALATDRWTAIELVGTGLLAGGVWAQWGGPWASMLLGALLIALSIVRLARSGGGE